MIVCLSIMMIPTIANAGAWESFIEVDEITDENLHGVFLYSEENHCGNNPAKITLYCYKGKQYVSFHAEDCQFDNTSIGSLYTTKYRIDGAKHKTFETSGGYHYLAPISASGTRELSLIKEIVLGKELKIALKVYVGGSYTTSVATFNLTGVQEAVKPIEAICGKMGEKSLTNLQKLQKRKSDK